MAPVFYSISSDTSGQTIAEDISAFYRDGQVFVTWTNINANDVRYNL